MKYHCLLLLLVGCATEGVDPNESESVAAVTACPTGTWCVETSPASSTTLLHAVWAITAEDVFAVGDSGTILRRNNDAWSLMTSGTTGNLRAVWGSSSSDVWAGGPSGLLLHYDGTAWSAVSGATADIDSIWGSGASDVWFAGQGTVLHWNGTGFSSSSFGGVLLSVSGSGPSDVWAIGENTSVHHWNGSSWASLNAGIGSTLLSVLTVAANDTWVAGITPPKETSHWNGSKWTIYTTGGALFNGMSALASNDIWGVGGSKVSHWNGTAWSTPEQPFGSASLWSVTTRPGNAWVVGSNALIAHRSF